MIELPEAITLGRQLRERVTGKVVARVTGPTKPHKFCWFAGDPAGYDAALRGRAATGAEGFGIFAEIAFEGGARLYVNDGVNARLLRAEDAPASRQLLVTFADGDALAFTVAMYGGILLSEGAPDDAYYAKSRAALRPWDAGFPEHFARTMDACKPSLSLKTFLATEQRFPGLGNGVLQDILFAAGMNPRAKLASLDAAAREKLLAATVAVTRAMTDAGGRDSEKDLFGQAGGYAVRMGRRALAEGCPVCGGPVTKETYLGGSVYWCGTCQGDGR